MQFKKLVEFVETQIAAHESANTTTVNVDYAAAIQLLKDALDPAKRGGAAYLAVDVALPDDAISEPLARALVDAYSVFKATYNDALGVVASKAEYVEISVEALNRICQETRQQSLQKFRDERDALNGLSATLDNIDLTRADAIALLTLIRETLEQLETNSEIADNTVSVIGYSYVNEQEYQQYVEQLRTSLDELKVFILTQYKQKLMTALDELKVYGEDLKSVECQEFQDQITGLMALPADDTLLTAITDYIEVMKAAREVQLTALDTRIKEIDVDLDAVTVDKTVVTGLLDSLKALLYLDVPACTSVIFPENCNAALYVQLTRNKGNIEAAVVAVEVVQIKAHFTKYKDLFAQYIDFANFTSVSGQDYSHLDTLMLEMQEYISKLNGDVINDKTQVDGFNSKIAVFKNLSATLEKHLKTQKILHAYVQAQADPNAAVRVLFESDADYERVLGVYTPELVRTLVDDNVDGYFRNQGDLTRTNLSLYKSNINDGNASSSTVNLQATLLADYIGQSVSLKNSAGSIGENHALKAIEEKEEAIKFAHTEFEEIAKLVAEIDNVYENRTFAAKVDTTTKTLQFTSEAKQKGAAGTISTTATTDLNNASSVRFEVKVSGITNLEKAAEAAAADTAALFHKDQLAKFNVYVTTTGKIDTTAFKAFIGAMQCNPSSSGLSAHHVHYDRHLVKLLSIQGYGLHPDAAAKLASTTFSSAINTSNPNLVEAFKDAVGHIHIMPMPMPPAAGVTVALPATAHTVYTDVTAYANAKRNAILIVGHELGIVNITTGSFSKI